MKKMLLPLLLAISGLTGFAQTRDTALSLIPIPADLSLQAGHFTLPPNITIEVPASQDLSQGIADLRTHLTQPTGYKVSVTNTTNPAAVIRLIINKTPDTTLGAEGYSLSVLPRNIILRANQPAGLFYGIQTLLQLFPKEIESANRVKGINWQAPCVKIQDRPRFGWRGLMLDVSRHFFTKAEVKDFIDQMVRYKYNVLHWHLTDDEGWRVEIKALPKLTEVGAWRVTRVGTFGNFSPADSGEAKNYGGFYTQDDIREIVKYAKDRFVNILPEVDVPGHSLASIVAYPELSCTPGADKYHVRAGEKIMNWGTPPGGFSALVDNTLCPANERVYVFLDKVFTEIAALFPFGYIHVGGDECAKNFWQQSDAIKLLMQKEGLKSMEEVQSYFEKRVENIVESKGKKIIGWDEILEGGLAPNALVMSWRGMKGGIQAAKMGHEVVMTPTTFAYLDYMQGDAMIEPPVYATLRLKTAYSFEPVPDGVDANLIKGGQGNLWSEQVFNTRHLQYMIWPRALALAECLWSPKEKKDWDNFAKRTEANMGRMDIETVKYSPAMFDPIFTVRKDLNANDSIVVDLTTEIQGLDIYYSFDNSSPDNFYPKCTGTLNIPRDASLLKVITYRNGKPIGRLISMPVKELRRRAGFKTEG